MSTQTKYLLQESQLPKFWYNIQADLPAPLPPVLHPAPCSRLVRTTWRRCFR